MSDSSNKSRSTGLDISVFFSFLFVLFVIADQFIKQVVVNKITVLPGKTKVIIEGFFSIFYCENTGSAFSLFADRSWGIYFLSGVSLVLGVVIFVLMIIASKHKMKLIAFAMCLLSAGAIGNLIDRFRLKYVIDYLRFDFGQYTFPVFNFADICAVCGTILFICIILFGSKYFEKFWNIIFAKKKKAEKETEADGSEELEETGSDNGQNVELLEDGAEDAEDTNAG